MGKLDAIITPPTFCVWQNFEFAQLPNKGSQVGYECILCQTNSPLFKKCPDGFLFILFKQIPISDSNKGWINGYRKAVYGSVGRIYG